MSKATPHDTGYKLLFSHPEMVRDLLIGYMPGEWLKEADFTSLKRVNGSYVSEMLSKAALSKTPLTSCAPWTRYCANRRWRPCGAP